MIDAKEKLIGELLESGYLKSRHLIEALRFVDRKDFVKEEDKDLAFENIPLPIGEGQTISQPLTVVFMLELLEIKEGERVLEIGTGSGWQTGLLAYLVGERGYVYTIERIEKLKDFALGNLSKYSFKNIKLILGDGSRGYEGAAPFDKITSAAEAREIPEDWKKQVKIGGYIVTPCDGRITRLKKIEEGKFEKEEYSGFAFVPLITD